MKYTVLAILVIASFCGVGCKKDKGVSLSPGCTLSSTTILGTYQEVGYTSQATPGSPVVDDYASYPACQKDNTVTLFADGTYERVDAGVTCSDPPEVIKGTWSLDGKTFTNDGLTGKVVSFDCHTLIINFPDYHNETGKYFKQ